MRFEGYFDVDARGHSGGIVILWKTKSVCTLVSYNNQYITMKVDNDDKRIFHLTGFYGLPNRSQRPNVRNLGICSNLSPYQGIIHGFALETSMINYTPQKNEGFSHTPKPVDRLLTSS
ncbi:hypothetical protein LINGRAHAP2_LOCUS10527 [Linum grandiflorum]